MTHDDAAVSLRVEEPRRVPTLSLFFGGVAMVPFVVGAILTWSLSQYGALFADLTLLWGSLILTFLAGVRRGVSFRTPRGPTNAQIAVMFALFVLGAGALLVAQLSVGTAALLPDAIAAAMLTVGYAMMLVLDPIAAERGEVPLFFERLRPVQMVVPVVCLLAVLIHVL